MTPGLLPSSELAPAQTATTAAPKAMVVTVPQLRLLQPLVWRCASLLHMVRGSLRRAFRQRFSQRLAGAAKW